MRDKTIAFKVSKEEKGSIHSHARKKGLGYAPFCRSLILSEIKKENYKEVN